MVRIDRFLCSFSRSTRQVELIEREGRHQVLRGFPRAATIDVGHLQGKGTSMILGYGMKLTTLLRILDSNPSIQRFPPSFHRETVWKRCP